VGSLLRLTGVCVTKDADVFGVDAEAVRGQLLVRGPGDIEVLKKPPFWTEGRLRWLLWTFLGVSVFAFAWVVTLRRRVHRQMAMIGHQLERQAIHEERARLAREWHDTLQQQLVGVSIQVQAASAQCKQAPELATQMLERADAMLRHSQAEARRSVWNLRNEILEQRGLAEALKELRLNEPGGPTVNVRSSGEAPRRLPAETEFHLLRIAQEAVANALQHAGAGTIELVLQVDCETITLSIEDDGRGFDPATAASGNGTHFGLLGMKERAAKIAAQLAIKTSAGQGTTITVTVKNQSSLTKPPSLKDDRAL
jgi:signal transduction histidine kinase